MLIAAPVNRNGIIDTRIRKRPRLAPPHSPHTVELWWDAQSSDAFLANSLPPLPSLSASGPPPPAPRSSQEEQQQQSAAPKQQQQQQQQQRRKKKRPPRQKPAQPRPRSLLAMMNANITTQRRMRRTHAKFVALGAATSAANNSSNNNAGAGGEDADGAELPTATAADVDGSEDAEVVAVDERPWPVPRPTRKETLQEGFVDPSPDIGERAAEKCMQWVNRKILEHIGFQGASPVVIVVVLYKCCARRIVAVGSGCAIGDNYGISSERRANVPLLSRQVFEYDDFGGMSYLSSFS